MRSAPAAHGRGAGAGGRCEHASTSKQARTSRAQRARQRARTHLEGEAACSRVEVRVRHEVLHRLDDHLEHLALGETSFKHGSCGG